MKRIASVLLLAMMTIFLTACSGGNKTDVKPAAKADTPKKLVVSCVAFNEPEIEAGVKALEKLGYDVKVTVLQDATTMCQAIMTGEINAALHPHKPWIDSYNAGNKTNVMMLTPYIHKNVFGMYSNKYKSVDQIPNGATIVIPQDESNMSRSLLLLQEKGLLTLKEGVTQPTDLDIKENPKNIKIQKVNVAQVVSSIPDVDAVCSAKMFIVSNGISQDYEICISDDLDKFGVGFIINPARKDEQWVKDLMTVYTSEEERAAIGKIFEGSYVPGF